MRSFFALLCLLGAVAVIGHALLAGSDLPLMRGAPQIEQRVARQATLALRPHVASAERLGLGVQGKIVVLRGAVATAEDRDAIVAAVRAVPLVGRIVDELEVLPVASPYRFRAEKAADGALSLAGHVPDRATEQRLILAASQAAAGAPLMVEVEIASGAPAGGWPERIEAALAALARLERGVANLSDDTGTVAGVAPDGASWEAAQAALAAAGDWRTDISGAAPAEGYLFTAMKAPDGTLLLDGHAPDPATRQALFEAAQSTGVSTVAGQLTIAAGMPEGWPDRVRAALQALGATANGLLTVTPETISLSGEVETEADRAVLAAYVGADWQTDILVLDPTPPSDVTILLTPSGGLSARGLLPEGVAPTALAAALPGIAVAGLDPAARGRAADWSGALGGLAIVFPSFEAAEARLVDRALSLRGNLKPGFSAAGTEAALRNALGQGWTVEADISDQPPPAEVMLSLRDGQIALSGVLPFGLEPGAALTLLGESAGSEGLTGGGAGDPDAWRANLAALANGLKLVRAATGRIGERTIELEATLAPGYAEDSVRAVLGAGLTEGWETALNVQETQASEGDIRVNLESGESETFRSGFWMPALDFEVSRGRCAQEAERTLAERQIFFISGSTEIDGSDTAALNRLAAIAVRCLNSSSMTLEIGGHTDSVGNDAVNRQISELRAQAVMAALTARGVRPAAMRATGYGESRPIATNDTAEGRAMNRRITFEWSGGDG